MVFGANIVVCWENTVGFGANTVESWQNIVFGQKKKWYLEKKTVVFEGQYSGNWCKYRNIFCINTVTFSGKYSGIWRANTSIWGKYSDILGANSVIFWTNRVFRQKKGVLGAKNRGF